MLQPLGITADAEAAYLLLAPLGPSTLHQLAQQSGLPTAQLEHRLDELRRLGLATELSGGLWRTLPLTDVVKSLRAQKISELEMATLAAESLHSHLLAATQSQTDDIRIVIGKEAIVATNRELCNGAVKEICMFDKPPYAEDRDAAEEILQEDAPEWQALDRGTKLRTIYHPGFDADRLKELSLFAAKGRSRAPDRCR